MSQESIKTLIDHGSLQVSHNCIFFFIFTNKKYLAWIPFTKIICSLLFLFLDQFILAGNTEESKQITANFPLSLAKTYTDPSCK